MNALPASVRVSVPRLSGVAPAFAVWLLVGALALSLAWWTWRLLAPTPVASTAAPASVSKAALAGQAWFAGTGMATPASSGRYVLRWTYPGRPGVCILAMPGLSDKAFKVGDEIEPGFALREVGEDYIIIEGRSGSERVERSREPASVGAQVPVAATAAPGMPANASAADPDSGAGRRDH